jgi:hypothetical protein
VHDGYDNVAGGLSGQEPMSGGVDGISAPGNHSVLPPHGLDASHKKGEDPPAFVALQDLMNTGGSASLNSCATAL